MGVNLSELSSFDLDKVKNESEQKRLTYDDSIGTDIAIIGMSVNLPEANDLSEYWNNLRDGKDSIVEFPETRKGDIEKYLRSLGSDTEDIEFFQAAFLNEIDKFDYGFFKLTPSEASLMSPVQRLFLETTYKTIEDAGYGGSKIMGSKTGVFVGCIGDAEEVTYADILSQSDSAQNPSAFTGNLTSMIPSRISYFLDLKGPSMVVDTACSSSLVAIHLACQAIRNGECDMALAGGIKLFLVPAINKIKLRIDSSNYRSKAFDDSSDGIGVGEGSAAVMLKPLSKALRDRDNIYAVIKGSAINQDGNSIGITAPNVAEQANVIAKAWKNARINPETISYIEAHGTGTNLGDPIEIEGIKRAFSRFTKKKQFCAIGSVKTNIGHLNEAAGIAGLIKLVLCLKYGEIPPSIHFNLPNRKIDFEQSPVYVNDRLVKWDTNGDLRRGAISSFGFSGTNCHMVLEEAPAIRHAGEVKSAGLFVVPISAKSEEALDKLLAAYNSFLYKNPNIEIRDLCYTASLGREHHNHRVAVIAQDLLSLKESISKLCSNGVSKSNYENVFFNNFKVIRGTKSTESDVGLTEDKLEGMNRLAHFKLEEFVRTNKSDKALLSEICSLYSNGADIDWSFLYEKERPQTISLPTYVFDKERCWCEIQEVAAQNCKYDSQKSFYNIVWKQKPLLKDEKGDTPQTIVILRSSEKSYSNFEDKLKNSSARIVSVTLGDGFKQINNNKYITDTFENSFNLLFDKIKESKSVQIVYLLAAEINESAKTTDELQRNLEHGLYSLFNIAKAVKGYDFDSTSILIVAGNISKIAENDNIIIPENATISGLAKVINREFTNISCRLIDIDDEFSEDDLVGELHLRSGEQQVAYRNGNRYVESFTEFDIDKSGNSEVKVRENGVYIITGGISGIGYEVGKYLANEAKVNIILVNRSKMPQRDTWDTISANNENKKLLEKISAIKSLEKTGSTVEYYSADVSDEIHVRNLINSIKEKYGNIHGIIHSAGVADDRLIIEKNKEDFDAIIRAKVYGTWLLNHFSNAENLDFFILFSSVSSILAAPGQGDYSAANAYLDSFSDYRRGNGKKATTINWVAWKEIGMAVEKGFTADTTFKAITTKKAMDCFDKVFHRDISRVLIGELNFESNMAALLEKAPFELSDDIKHKLKESAKQRALLKEQNVSNNRPNVRLKGKETNQYSKIEQQIAEVCMAVLGFKEIDIYDNFFDLGADSIALSQMFKELDKYFPNMLSVTKVFAYPSISALAKYLSEQLDESDSQGSHDNLMLEEESEPDKNDSIAIIGIVHTCQQAIIWMNSGIAYEMVKTLLEIYRKIEKRILKNIFHLKGRISEILNS
ncbi:SDR family oxidoreductase [Ruminiclostridium josui]|uniref:SDR family oxidoreductase n=1 Tax=Ruminiclostridium josui TaxID=1499 RepID=UPI0006CF9E6E|nr:SDR family oxidoreductase [Ruminiclostridium josui]